MGSEMCIRDRIEAGYVSIGMDHYSKPDDEFAIALKEKKLHRNFQGYCTRETTGQVYGFGASSISQLDSAYSQNIKTTSEYIDSIQKTGLAVLRGYSLNENEKIIRHIINSIMCNYYVDLNDVANYFSVTVDEVRDIINFSPVSYTHLTLPTILRV